MASWLECRRVALEQTLLLAAIPENGQVLPASKAEFLDRVSAKQIVPPYSLSLSREYDVCHDFAFLSSVQDDPNRVTAVAVEDNGKAGLVVRLAANQGDTGALARKFSPIAKALEAFHQNVESTNALRTKLLKAIIHVCLQRILRRLQSKFAKRHGKDLKVSPIVRLQRFSNRYSFRKEVSVQDQEIARRSIREMNDLFQSLERSVPGARELIAQNLVCKVHQFTTRFKITRDWTIPLDQDVLGLEEKLHKLSRYQVISERFERWTRKYSVFSNVRFLAVEKIDLDTAVVKNQIPSSSDLCIKYDQILQPLPGRVTVEARVRSEHEKIGRPKVHSEVQLLLFYQQNSSTTVPGRPRVICASKSACYLCYTLFRAHGQHVIPACHGKIYSAWTFPDISPNRRLLRDMLPTVGRFNAALAEQKSVCIGREPAAIRNCGNESPYGSEYLHGSYTTIGSPIPPSGVTRVDSGIRMVEFIPDLPHEAPTLPPDAMAIKLWEANKTPGKRESNTSLNSGIPLDTTAQSASAQQDNTTPDHVMREEVVLDPAVVRFDDLQPNAAWTQQELEPTHSTIVLRIPVFEVFLHHLPPDHIASIAQSCWVGYKLISTERTYKQALDAARVGFSEETTVEDGAALVDHPIILSLGGRSLIVKFSFRQAPPDPLPETDCAITDTTASSD